VSKRKTSDLPVRFRNVNLASGIRLNVAFHGNEKASPIVFTISAQHPGGSCGPFRS